MDKKEIIEALWKLEGNLNEFMQKVRELDGSKYCNCAADEDKIGDWMLALKARAKSISTDRDLIEQYKDSPEMNAILYRENKKQTEALMARVIKEAKGWLGAELA